MYLYYLTSYTCGAHEELSGDERGADDEEDRYHRIRGG